MHNSSERVRRAVKHAFLDKYAYLKSPLHQLDVRMKIFLFVSILLISLTTPPKAFPAFGGYALVLLGLALLAKLPLRFLILRLGTVFPFVVFLTIFLPFMPRESPADRLVVAGVPLSREGLVLAWNIAAKSGIGVTSLIVLVSTTPFDQLMRGLEWFRLPRFFTVLANFAYRYVFVIVEEAMRMKRAKELRTLRRESLRQVRTVGVLVGTLFLRSFERSERIYSAMCLRGFSGRYAQKPIGRVKLIDFATAAFFLLATFTVRWVFR